MRKAIYFTFASTLALAGCSGSTSDGSLYSSFATGSGGNASSSTATGAGGAGGPECTVASVTIDGDGPTNHLGAACKDSWGSEHTSYANGYVGYPGNTGKQLFVSACVNGTSPLSYGSLSLIVPQTTIGSATMGTASYANGLDTFTTDTEVTLALEQIDSKVVKGSYTANVGSTSNGTKMLSGTFSVCRVPDFLPP